MNLEPSALAPPHVQVLGMTKRFADVVALEDVSLTLAPGSVHAILGENGAGKSTLVKCMMGYHRPDAGRLLLDGHEQIIANPRAAHALGFGMVYQHFTLVPSMTVAENLVLGLPEIPQILRWDETRARIETFMGRMPFRLDLDRPAVSLAAGEKQKLELLKQLFLGSRVLILDEPTSVLTPDEADQILGIVRQMTLERRLTVVLITHKLREVQEFAQEVTVLRSGRRVGGGPLEQFGREDLVRLMIGAAAIPMPGARAARSDRSIALEILDLTVRNDRGVDAVCGASLCVDSGQIVGIAGVSGNGQRELVQALAGQREPECGAIRVGGVTYGRTRLEKLRHHVSILPEEPLQSACVRGMTVEENLAFRDFDQPECTIAGWFLNRRALRKNARDLMARYRVRAHSSTVPLDTLSGGNIQRVVLARELSGTVQVLIAQNPCAGLDLAATAEIRSQILAARNAGAAVLLLSEDLDEILELADRIAVIFEGRIVYETPRDTADLQTIGRAMAGHP